VPKQVSLRGRALEARDAVELLSDKWRIPVLHVLTTGPLRSGRLQRMIAGVSSKVLTETLRGMERDGLITRKLHAAVPPRVEYGLTAMGRSSLRPLRELCHWARKHAPERERARGEFDAKSRS
jgi:DNA-binding HxlR family transcriptional regulator